MGPPRKKQYFAVPRVKDFMDGQSDEVRAEYNTIIGHLEADGLLKYPEAERVRPGLFAIRITQAGNVRVFYVYAEGDKVWGIHAFEKKTRKIPAREVDYAVKVMRALRQYGR